MPIISRGTSSDTANPVLMFLGSLSGWLTDVFELSFQVWRDGAQIYPVSSGQKQAVDLEDDRLGVGRYVANWTATSNQALGAHEVRWFSKQTSTSPERVSRQAFEVVAALPALGPFYASPSELAAEGSKATEARALLALSIAGQFLETATHTFFEPRALTMGIDGKDGSLLHMEHAIVAIESVTIDGSLLDATNLVVYNRPDDRKNPKLARKSGSWRRGRQNIEVLGVFGCVGPDGGIHPLARQATKLLAMRELDPIKSDARSDTRNRHRILSEATREQSYTLASVTGGSGASGGLPPWITGDPEIDQLILALRGPGRVTAV